MRGRHIDEPTEPLVAVLADGVPPRVGSALSDDFTAELGEVPADHGERTVVSLVEEEVAFASEELGVRTLVHVVDLQAHRRCQLMGGADRERPQIGDFRAHREDGNVDRDAADLVLEVFEGPPFQRILVEVRIGAVVLDRDVQLLGPIRALYQERDVQKRL